MDCRTGRSANRIACDRLTDESRLSLGPAGAKVLAWGVRSDSPAPCPLQPPSGREGAALLDRADRVYDLFALASSSRPPSGSSVNWKRSYETGELRVSFGNRNEPILEDSGTSPLKCWKQGPPGNERRSQRGARTRTCDQGTSRPDRLAGGAAARMGRGTAASYASSLLTTWPCTSVSRKSRPMWRYVSFS